MTELVYMVDCRTCGSLQPIDTVATDWSDGRPVAWERRCATCEAVFGVMLDGGTLDLGLIRDSVLNQTNDFKIWQFRGRWYHRLRWWIRDRLR